MWDNKLSVENEHRMDLKTDRFLIFLENVRPNESLVHVSCMLLSLNASAVASIVIDALILMECISISTNGTSLASLFVITSVTCGQCQHGLIE